ncbi:hypothetical protein [Clostridium sp. 1001283B150210_160208_E6]|uniref:hypothetical protein n=1 Tax=Clostridium sp. 1001283B150210_160208_E6 TaxID=2787129 RepID=UPI0018A92DD1|nr:hypothetical protein [Clostridium sp. 1001283B150210_160208_E6]
MKEIKQKSCSIGWTDEVVYTVFCNDDLKTLSMGILKQMRNHIDSIIEIKNSACSDYDFSNGFCKSKKKPCDYCSDQSKRH